MTASIWKTPPSWRCGPAVIPKRCADALPPPQAPMDCVLCDCAPVEVILGASTVFLSGADLANHAGLSVSSKHVPLPVVGELAGVLIQAPAWSTAETSGASWPASTMLRGWRWHAVGLTSWDTLRLHSHRAGTAVIRPYFLAVPRWVLTPDELKARTLEDLT